LKWRVGCASGAGNARAVPTPVPTSDFRLTRPEQADD
jgi:hypothetical protein